MPEKDAANLFFQDRLMWSCVLIVVAGTVARVFRSGEKIDLRLVLAESVLAAVGAIGIYAGAEMQGLDGYTKIFVSVMMSLGGIHGLQRAMQVWQTLKGGK